LTDFLQNDEKKKKNQAIAFGQKDLAAFNEVKSVLAQATLLVHMKADAPICLPTDASDVGVGGVLQQHIQYMESGNRYPCSPSVCNQLTLATAPSDTNS